jgi:hypothetical protein
MGVGFDKLNQRCLSVASPLPEPVEGNIHLLPEFIEGNTPVEGNTIK